MVWDVRVADGAEEDRVMGAEGGEGVLGHVLARLLVVGAAPGEVGEGEGERVEGLGEGFEDAERGRDDFDPDPVAGHGRDAVVGLARRGDEGHGRGCHVGGSVV